VHIFAQAVNAAGGAGKQAWRARGVIALVGFFVFALIDLWLRGSGRR
jgi:hypothetical protein